MRARVCVRCEYVCVVCRTGDREWVCKGYWVQGMKQCGKSVLVE